MLYLSQIKLLKKINNPKKQILPNNLREII